jgi:putative restriction endonuclease
MTWKLEKFRSKLKKLNVDRNKNRYTEGRAPHKPLLLISLALLEKNDKIDLADIRPNLYLRETWGDLWNCLEYERVGPIHLPMYHMKSEGFWDIDLNEGMVYHQPKSLNELMDMSSSIHLDEDVVEFFRSENSRNEIINSLLHGGYFSDNEIRKLKGFIERFDNSFVYEEKLNQMMKEEFKQTPDIGEMLKESRDPAFRRIVLEAYDETCSFCSMKLTTTSGISVIDAAHILPFSKFKNDDVRNGLALCKLHHWLFDRGLMTVDKHYRVKVSKTIEKEKPELIVSGMERKEIILPQEMEKIPSQIALDWHRKEIFSLVETDHFEGGGEGGLGKSEDVSFLDSILGSGDFRCSLGILT